MVACRTGPRDTSFGRRTLRRERDSRTGSEVDTDVDVAVVGLGAMGGAALWRLALRGAGRVAGFDRFAPPHDRGSSHGESRIIRSAYFEDPAYLPLVREAFGLWRELERESGESLLLMTGAAMIGGAAAEVVAGALETARVHGLAYELLAARAAAARFPQHALDDDDVVVCEADAGVLHPERCVAAMLARAQAMGATAHTDVRVSAVQPTADGAVVVHTPSGDVRAAHAVVCAGPWMAKLLPSLPVPLWVERQVMAWLPVRTPELFAPSRFPVFIRQQRDGPAVYGLPSLDGATVKLAVHHDGDAVDPDDVPRVSDDDVAPLLRFARERMHGVEPHVVRAAVCLYTNTPDEHFVVGALPDCERITVVSACSGHGFKFAPVIGDVVADLVLDGATRRPVERFAPGRFAGG